MLVWKLDLCETFITYFIGKIPSIFISDTKPVTSAACDSPHKASAAPGLFHSSYLRKVEKYFCVVRWISRLYSLQYSPLNSHSAIPETTTSLLPVPGKYEVECLFFWPSHSTLCPWLSFWKKKNAEQHGSVQYQKCCRRCYRASEIFKKRKKKKVFTSHFCWFLSLCVVNQKKPNTGYRASLWFQGWICDWSSLQHGLFSSRLKW